MSDTGHVVNLDPSIVNRLIRAVRRLCAAEVKMKSLKSEFKDLKNEVTSLAETILGGSQQLTNINPGTIAGGSVVAELMVPTNNTLVINTEEEVPYNEINEAQHVSIVTNISTTSVIEPEVLNEQGTKRSNIVITIEETTCKKQKIDDKENIVDLPGENSVSVPDDKDYVEVFACGECENNGRPWGRAGLGVFFAAGSVMNCSLPIEGSRTTHNAASIDACIQALRLGIEYGIKKINIFIESEFSHNCITKWMGVWKENNWKTFTGGKVKFRNELERLDKLTCHFEGIKWTLETDDVRIKEAKNLAQIGTMKYVRLGNF